MSGRYVRNGAASLGGAEAAIGEINAAGGLLGRPVELVIEDNLSTADGTVSGYFRIRDRIHALGGIESIGAEALLDVLAADRMPTFCPACGTALLDTAGGNYIWRIAPSATNFATIAAQLARDLGYTRVAILAAEAAPWMAHDPADRFRDAWENKVGGQVIAEVRFESRTGASPSQIAEAFGVDPEAVFLSARIYSAIPFLRQYIDRGYEATIFVSREFMGLDFAELVGPLPTGVIRGAWFIDDLDSPAYATFDAAHRRHVGTPPAPYHNQANQTRFAAGHFDQYIALALAITAAGTTDGAAVAAQVPAVLNAPGTKVSSYADGVAALQRGEDIDYDGASGSLELDEYGNLVSPRFSITVVVDGEWSRIEILQLDPSLNP